MGLDRFLLRRQESRAELARELAAARRAPACAEDRLGCAFTPGARVFDTVTGQEGEVVGGTVENLIVPTPGRNNG